MSNWLAYFGGAVAALLAALFAVPAMIDWNGYRGIFEEEATRVLGRDVRLGGKVNLRLLPAPYVSFERMRISDPDSQTGEPLFRTENFTMWLALSPLAQGVLQASQIELDKPVLKLAINEDGTGNWSRLQLTPGTLPFVPADVMLNSVRLRGGEIGLVGPKGNELGKLEAIDGELIADSLKGPFRYRGKVTWGGEVRDVRFASAAPDAGGEVRFKVSATGTGINTNSSYILDGRAADLGGKLSLNGDLAAKIAPDLSPDGHAQAAVARSGPVAPAPEVSVSPTPGAEQKTAVPIPAAAQTGAPLYDLRSKLSGDADGVKLTEISITSEGGGPPQLITGSAEAAWGERTRIDLALNSRWIDLDAMFGSGGKPVVPLEAARGLFDVLMRQLPASSDTNVNLSIDQMNLGADQISNVRFAAVRAGGPLEVKDFQVGLPGATQLSLSGKLAPADNAPKFEGLIGLKGQSLSRFLAWGLKEPAVTDRVSDGAFAINGGLKFSAKQIELTNAKVGVGETPVIAGVRLDLTERRRLAVTLEGQRIDVGHVWPGGLQMEGLTPVLLQNLRSGDAVSAVGTWFDPSNTDLTLGIKAGTVVDGTRRLRNVEADVSLEGGKLAMRQLKFGDDTGLEVELEGEASDLKSAAQGGVRGLIVAPATTAAQSFVDLAGLDTYAPGLAAYLQRLAPLRLAGTVQLGGRAPGAADIKLDGTIRGGGRAIATIELDGGFTSWRTANAGITVRVDTPDIDQSLVAIIETAPQLSSPHAARRGQILARATGVPQDGLQSFASVAADGISLSYSGRVLMPSDAPLGLQGDVEVAGRDGRTLVSLAGLNMPAAVAETPISGVIAITKAADTLTLKPGALEIAGTPVGGEMTIKAPSSGGRTAVTAFLTAEEARLPGLLSSVLGGTPLAIDPKPAAPPPTKANASPPAPPQPASIWPEQAFDFSGQQLAEGRITVHFGQLSLEPGFSVRNAKMDVTFEPDKLAVTSLEGDAVGGKLTSSFAFTKEQGGVGFNGELNIRVPHEPASSTAQHPDIASLSLKFDGRALSPAALISSMKGTGELKLGDVSLGGMSPAVIGSVSEAALLGKGPQQGQPLYDALRTGLREGQLRIGELAVPVTIAEGTMKLAKVQFDKDDGRTAFETVVDLATLRLDSEWTVEAKLPKSAGRAGGKLLPPVSVVYAGMLKDITAIEPQISATALERELTVRKMEHDVEELERLRKEDEQRAKQEQARIKAEQEIARQEKARIDAERAAAAAAAAVDDPQPAPDPNAAGAVDQTPLPPAGAPTEGSAAQQQAAGANPSATPPEANGTQQAPRQPPPKRRPPPKENWNPFTGGF